MTGLICLLTILISNWSISTLSENTSLIQIYIKGYPILVEPLVKGPWNLYLHTYQQEEIVGVGANRLVKEQKMAKRYYLVSQKETIILTPHNFATIIKQQFPDEDDLHGLLDQVGLRFGNLARLIEQCNTYQQQMVVIK